MRHKSFADADCPVACTLQLIGEWWSILILREAMLGQTRFDQFRKRLQISPTMLTRRLQALVEAGLLERRQYCAHPPRDEYLLTEKGRSLQPVLEALRRWGEVHLPCGEPEDQSAVRNNSGKRAQ
jgi:DNA-binding HxlR family transcriptional regulator